MKLHEGSLTSLLTTASVTAASGTIANMRPPTAALQLTSLEGIHRRPRYRGVMASCANSHHFSLLQHSFPFWFLQICEFANASAGPPTKVAYLRTKNLIFVILERRSSGEFLAELYRKMFLRQTPDFVNFVLAAAGDVRNSSGDGE